MNPTQIILSGSLLVSLPLAVLAGLVSFLSPCVLPLVPGYLGYVSGMAASRKKLVLGSSLFVLGFAVVFVALGSAFGAVGAFLVSSRFWLQPLLGALVIIFGFAMIGQFSLLQREVKLQITPRAGLWFAPVLGIVFGLGWTPCIGPTLSAVMTLALTEAGAASGALLAFAYALGLGLPFVLLAAGFGWASKSVRFVREHIRAFNLFGGSLLVLLGLLLVTGIWNVFVAQIQGVFGGFLPAL